MTVKCVVIIGCWLLAVGCWLLAVGDPVQFGFAKLYLEFAAMLKWETLPEFRRE